MTRIDRLLILLLQIYGAAALIALALVPTRFLPSEDALILFEYSRNLAQHGSISFLANGPRVEGATDFGWMILIAAAMRLSVAPFQVCALANVCSLIGLGATLLRLAGLRIAFSGLMAVAGAAALCRQIFAAASGFDVLPNAFLLALLVLCVTRGYASRAAGCALALCLLRPDGVVFALPLLAYLALARHEDRPRTLTWIAGGFVLPGILYFFWRWHYFGELLPLPFLVKADFYRDLGIFVGGSMRASVAPLLFTFAAIAPVLWLRRRGNGWLVLALIGLPTLFYWCMRLDQNVGSRFFFYLPAAAAILLAFNWQALGKRKALAFRAALAAWAILFAAPLYRESLTFRYMQFGEVRSIARALGALPQHGLLLTSEAGFLPYYSGWPAVDTWGLNTPKFAHRFFRPEDVEKIRPDLIVTHPDLTESCLAQPGWLTLYPDRSWPHMTRNLIEGAAPAHYELWLTTYGSEFYRLRKHWQYGEGDRECWLVRRDSPLRDSLEKILAAHHAVPPAEATELEQQHAPLGGQNEGSPPPYITSATRSSSLCMESMSHCVLSSRTIESCTSAASTP